MYFLHSQEYWRNQKPPAGSWLDRTHPLSNGLVGCWLFNENAGNVVYDVAKNSNSLVTSPARVRTTGLFISASSGYVQTSNLTNFIAYNSPCTFVLNMLYASGTTIFGKGTATTMHPLRVTTNKFDISRNSSNTTYKRLSATDVSVTRFQTWGASWNGVSAGANFHIYLNGQLNDGTSAGSGTITADATAWRIGAGNGGAAGALITYFYAWNRVLSASEIFAISTEPYQIVLPPEPSATVIDMGRYREMTSESQIFFDNGEVGSTAFNKII
jgi:hypothetical protein